jgi:hypothetical protein
MHFYYKHVKINSLYVAISTNVLITYNEGYLYLCISYDSQYKQQLFP